MQTTAQPIPQATEATEVYVARQPIFDRKLGVVGYELLFPDAHPDQPEPTDREAASMSVLGNALTEIGLERIVGSKSAWIKVSPDFVRHGMANLLPSGTVLELQTSAPFDAETLSAMAELRVRGVQIALEHFRSGPDSDRLLDHADIVKLDVAELGHDDLALELAALEDRYVERLASHTETRQDFAFCKLAGCDLFQGYFFCRPEQMGSRRIDANRLAVLDLLAGLNDPNIELADLERTIAVDVGLSVRFLRYINSAYFGLRAPVRSIGQALALLGIDRTKQWAALTLFSSIDDKPKELTLTALVRARFCEQAGALRVSVNPSEYFTLGLFSVIDALLDTSIEEALSGIPLALDIREALVRRSGPMGELLDCVSSIETGDFQHAREIQPDAARIFTSSLEWADRAVEPLYGEI